MEQALERVKVEYVCADCGGRKVRRYGVMGWSVERQAWEREPLIVTVLDTPSTEPFCAACGGDAFAENLGQQAEGLLHNPVPSPLPLAAETDPIECQGCDWKGVLGDQGCDVAYIKERLSIAMFADENTGVSVIPVGDCPSCGALAYRSAALRRFDRLLDLERYAA